MEVDENGDPTHQLQSEEAEDKDDIWWFVCTICNRAFTVNNQLAELQEHKWKVHGSRDVDNLLILSQSISLEPKLPIKRCQQPPGPSQRTMNSSPSPRGHEKSQSIHSGTTRTLLGGANGIKLELEEVFIEDDQEQPDSRSWSVTPSPPPQLAELQGQGDAEDEEDPDYTPDMDHHEEEDEEPESEEESAPTAIRRPTQTFETTPEGRLKCPTCDKDFSFRSNLWQHIKVVHGPPAARKHCPKCEKTLSGALNLKKHLRWVHGVGPPFPAHPCPQCGRTFQSPSRLRSHLRAHNSSRTATHMCSVCSRSFTTLILLRQHEGTHKDKERKSKKAKLRYRNAPGRRLKCPTCDKDFSSKATLNEHMKIVHAPPGSRKQCPKCEKTLCSSNQVTSHLRHVHGVGTPLQAQICQECGRTCKSAANLRSHLRVHDPNRTATHTCTVCARSFLTLPILRTHEQTHSERTFMCSECGNLFKTKVLLQRHQKNMHSDEMPSFACDKCPLRFKKKETLVLHKARHAKEASFVCSQCPKAYKTKVDLRQHTKRLHGAKPIRNCRMCSLEFKGRISLQRHEMQVHGVHRSETSYKCTHEGCGAKFPTKGTFQAHVTSHKDVRSLKCPDCDKEFKTNANLYQHSISHLPYDQLPYVCEVCGKRSGFPGHMRQHRRNVHGIQ